MYVFIQYICIGRTWNVVFCILFLFWRTFYFRKKKCGKMRMLNHGNEVGEYTWTQASCDVDFFVCIHEPRMMYIDSTHHFHGKGLFFISEEIQFCNFGLPHLWIVILRVTWVDSLTFLFAPFPFHPSLIPRLLLVGWYDQPGLGFDVILTLV